MSHEEIERHAGWGEFKPTQLVLRFGMDLEEWASRAPTLGGMERSSPWWTGDWLVYGEDRFGEKYAQFVEQTGLHPRTLVNRAYVSRAVAPERRLEGLSHSHHYEVASLEAAQQSSLLRRALEGDPVEGGGSESWTVSRLRNEVRELKGKASNPGGATRVKLSELADDLCDAAAKLLAKLGDDRGAGAEGTPEEKLLQRLVDEWQRRRAQAHQATPASILA